METQEKINNAIAHLNGYALILEKEKNIPAFAVKETITELKEKTITIKFWDNENYEYPLIVIKEKDLDIFKKLLEEYQKDDEYNFDDFIGLIKEKGYFIETISNDIELFF